jgi:hypothetical protein
VKIDGSGRGDDAVPAMVPDVSTPPATALRLGTSKAVSVREYLLLSKSGKAPLKRPGRYAERR